MTEDTKNQENQTEKEEIEVPKKFKKLVEEIEQMKVADLAELVKILEKKFGVTSAPAPMMVQPAPQTGQPEQGEEEKSEYDILLTQVGDKKIEVIKIVRDLTQKGLKESKDLVDAVQNEPQLIKSKVKKEEAEEIKKKFEEVGAKVELK